MIDMTGLNKPINTCLSSGTDLNIDSINEAKKYLTTQYNNKYSLPPHLTFMICPFPEYNLELVKTDLENYFKDKRSFVFSLGELQFEAKRKFYSIPVIGEEIMDLHRDLISLFNKYRDGHVREKDIERIKSGECTPQEIELTRQYGYFRIFEKFTPHITVGNIEVEDSEIPQITIKLIELLKDIEGKDITINKLNVIFHTDSTNQKMMKEIWIKDYVLI